MKTKYILPFVSLLAVTGHVSGQEATPPVEVIPGQMRVDEVMGLINKNYVEGPDMEKMSEAASSTPFRQAIFRRPKYSARNRGKNISRNVRLEKTTRSHPSSVFARLKQPLI